MPLSRRDFIHGAGILAAAGAVQATGQELQPVIDVGSASSCSWMNV